jgi:hypothetical protein
LEYATPDQAATTPASVTGRQLHPSHPAKQVDRRGVPSTPPHPPPVTRQVCLSIAHLRLRSWSRRFIPRQPTDRCGPSRSARPQRRSSRLVTDDAAVSECSAGLPMWIMSLRELSRC